ncbi:hypothetical protein ABZP36_031693 [Zizania latifolia]
MPGDERPCSPIDPAGGSGQSTACDSPVMWDDDGDGMTAVAGFNLFEEASNDPPTKNGMVDNPDTTTSRECNTGTGDDFVKREQGKNHWGGAPIREHTGIWVPVSVPPMTEHQHEQCHKGFGRPEDEFSWEMDEENKEMTMWDVFSEMVVMVKGKVISIAPYDLGRYGVPVVSKFFFQEGWKDMAQTLADANADIANELLEREPITWLPDSAAQLACSVTSWLNFPYSHKMEYEIYKAANSLHSYCKLGKLKPEKAIPDAILKQAKGLAIITVVKAGMMVTYKVGTGLVIARRADGSWSPPSAISTCGIGYGAQVGGELADFIIVLRNTDAINTFSGKAHLSVGAGVSASVGHVGRVAEADFRAGDGGYTTCYTYSCTKGAFVGCALNGSIVSTRDTENARFYGGPIKASDILMGSMARPPAAAVLYKVLLELFDKPEKQSSLALGH